MSRADEFDRFFDDMFNVWQGVGGEDRAWMPSVDVIEKNGDYEFKAELPGMKKEDIDVVFDNGELVIRGERKWEDEEKKENYRRVERRYGKFERRFVLPEQVKSDEVKAEYEDGVLSVVVPKIEAPKPKQIAVEVK
jgi:HSP20 family protein